MWVAPVTLRRPNGVVVCVCMRVCQGVPSIICTGCLHTHFQREMRSDYTDTVCARC